MARLALIILFCVVTAGALSCKSTVRRAVDSLMTPQGEPLPKSFTSEEGGFTIGLPPAQPKCKTIDSASGRHNSCEFFWLILNMGKFTLRYLDGGAQVRDAESARAVLQRLRDLSVEKNGGGKLARDAAISVDGFPGREIVFEGDEGVFIQRFYLVGGRTFDLNVFLPSDYTFKREEAALTLDTFRLTPETLQTFHPAPESE